MNIQYINNHIIIPVETNCGVKNVLLDTGNPVSTVCNDDTVTEISVCDIQFTLQSNFMVSQFKRMIDWHRISSFVKTPIDGFIGYDFLINNDIIIDLHTYKISLNESSENFDLSDINFFMNVPIITMNIQQLTINAIFDTGAMHSIVHSGYKNILTDKHQSMDEYNPMLGSFKADIYSGNIQVGNTPIHNCTIACSEKYDMAMNMVMGQNVEGFLGIGSLEGKQIFLSYKNRKIGLQNAL